MAKSGGWPAPAPGAPTDDGACRRPITALCYSATIDARLMCGVNRLIPLHPPLGHALSSSSKGRAGFAPVRTVNSMTSDLRTLALSQPGCAFQLQRDASIRSATGYFGGAVSPTHSSRPIALYDGALGKGLRADQGEAPGLGQPGKDRKALTQYDRNDRQFELVD
jgi:hypothetical protein